LSHKVDFSEPIPKMIDRLIREHRELAPKLDEIAKASEDNPEDAVRLLVNVRSNILRHAVEEEARIMRIIMKDEKSESGESVRIMQEHRWVSEFLERRTDKLSGLPSTQTKVEIQKFLNDLRQHFKEEEEIVFPLALKALASEG
jgi:iron-sulfur cluster repair protein YtfE (RIC family)